MFIPFSRAIVLAVLYLSVLTNAVPVVEDGSELVVASGLVDAGHDAQVVNLEARARTSRPRPRPRPKPVKTIVRKPAPVKTTIRRPKPTKTVVKRPTAVPRPPVKATPKPAPRPAKPPVKATPKPAPRPTKPPVKATPKPAPRPTKPPVKATPKPAPRPTKPPVKPAPKPTKTGTTKPTATPTKAPQCPINNKPTKGTKGPRALYEWAVGLFKRDNAEFIGWHGTNSNTAQLWASAGYLADPATSGWPWSSGGRSGADHELGEGVYITDAMETARGFANNNAVVNKGTVPMLCGIFARSSATWKSSINKVWLPNAIIRDSSNPALHVTYEKQRNEWIGRVIPHSTGRDVARFGPLDKNRSSGPKQVVIPSALTRYLYAVCVDARTHEVPLGANTHIDFDTARHPWNVRDTPCR